MLVSKRGLPTCQLTNLPTYQFSHSVLDICHEIDKVHVAACRARAGVRALQHNRTERARGDDRGGARRLQLSEADVADARPGLLFLVREEQTASGAAAER